jgi:hypothetical protein
MTLAASPIASLAAVMIAACASAPPPPAAASHVQATPEPLLGAGAPPVPNPLPAEPESELIVGNAGGLIAWTRDGSSQRQISAGAALHPRLIDEQTVLVVAPVKPEADAEGWRLGARLERISLATGERAIVAHVPGFSCANEKPEEYQYDLSVQDARDFEVAADKMTACVELMDRNTNMASVQVLVRVDLISGGVKRWMTVGEAECKPPEGVVAASFEQVPGCESAASRASDATAAYPFSFEEEKLLQASEAGKPALKVKLRGYDVELASPSGRWLVLAGDPEEGDYLYRRLVLLDRASGQLYPIPEEPGSWPSPLVAAKTKRIKQPIEAAILVEGERELRWFGDAESELLIVGDLVVRPGEALFRVDGEIAR